MNRRFVFVSIAVFFAICMAGYGEAADKTPQQLVQEAKAVIQEVTVGDSKKMLDAKEALIVLDVRDSQEFAEGHIPGAINISRGSLEFKVAMIVPDKRSKIIVYCGLDLRAPLATKTLNDLGYKKAVNMIGGLEAWKTAGYPTVK
jgi:adenylyltransferase/sulfurtransferase